MDFDIGFLLSVLRIATPLMFAALAVLLAERAGVFFMGVEGCMLLGAFFGFLGASAIGSAWLGVLTGSVAGLVGGAVLVGMTVLLPTNQIVIGLAFNIVCVGMTSFVFRMVSASLPSMTPVLAAGLPEWVRGIPGAQTLLAVPVLTWLALGMTVLILYFLYRMPAGLMLRSVGHNCRAALAAGVNIRATRALALIMAGWLTGVGGAALTVGWVRSFSDEITMGRGFIALAAVYFGRWHPRLTILACVLFGLGDALGFRAQMLGSNPHWFLMTPYLLTIIGVAIAGRARAPQEVGQT